VAGMSSNEPYKQGKSSSDLVEQHGGIRVLEMERGSGGEDTGRSWLESGLMAQFIYFVDRSTNGKSKAHSISRTSSGDATGGSSAGARLSAPPACRSSTRQV
jgi:hypothetical protein